VSDKALTGAVTVEHGLGTVAHVRGHVSPERVNTLSDGVFAIALTVLTFDVVAAATGGADGVPLAQHLQQQWPAVVAYAIGFMTILVCWINHHFVFGFVHRSDAGLLWVNGVQLALVALVPFPTALLAAHLAGDAHDRRTALLCFGAVFFFIATSFWMLWRYVARRGLIDEPIDPIAARGIGMGYGLASLWTVCSLLVALVSVVPALVMWTVMFMVFAFPATFSKVTGRGLSGPTPTPRSAQ
jgi:uncharacterized membrane protein